MARLDIRRRSPALRRRVRRHPILAIAAGILVLLIAAAYVVAYRLDEPIRREMEQRLNASLEGYGVTIGAADFHPLGFGLDLEDLVVVQKAAPDPPVARIDEIEASVQWRALVSGALVADVALVRPVLRVTRRQAAREVEDPVPIEERGWQEAVQEVYPLEINELRVVDGDVTYVAGPEADPVRVEWLSLVARDIRNVRTDDDPYPSPIALHARTLGDARIDVEGAADFLAVPHPTVRADVRIAHLDLGRIAPLAREVGLEPRAGTVAARGRVEYAAERQVVALEEVTLHGLDVDYRRDPAARVDLVEAAAEGATTPARASETVVRIGHLEIADGTVGLVDVAADPAYRLFLTDLDLSVRRFSNERGAPPGEAELDGRFMGSGDTHAVAHFTPAAARADFDLALEIGPTQLQTMNDLWRAYGNFDVAGGTFAFYSALDVEDGRIDGYVKPIFSGLDVYDREQDREDNLFVQAYESLLGGIASLLENRPRDTVATETDLSGSIENPETSTLQVVVGLVRHAFFQAILPGLERRSAG